MGCSGCSTGRGCSTTTSGTPAGCRNNGSCGSGGCNKLNVFDWLANMELPHGQEPFDAVEIRFKNSRKEFFRNVNKLPLVVGELVAVEASPGHDIGTISLTGELVRMQMNRKGVKPDAPDLKKVYRKAREADVEKWQEAQQQERATMMRSREIAVNLGLQMKIGDVEYQGDKSKAIFYYTADERVDFRELIKMMADEFKIRVEMRQIGARQEAGRLGGIGTCGRELCCSTWLSDFRSVTTGAARYQQLSLNPIKLAGQCGKLKCCLNYELDGYVEALKSFPETVDIESKRGRARHQKSDIFRGLMWYAYADDPGNFIPIKADKVKEIVEMNKRGEKPEELTAHVVQAVVVKEHDFENVVGQDSLTRFDQQKKNKKKKKKRPSANAGAVNAVGGIENPNPNPNPKPQQRRDNRPQQQRQPQQNKPPQNQGGQQQNNPQPKQNNKPRRNNGPRFPRNNGGQKPTPPPAV